MIAPTCPATIPSSMLSCPGRPPSRKRPHETAPSNSIHDTATSVKRRKTQSQRPLRAGHHYGGRFWDSLSQVHLTKGALKEFNGRTQPSEITVEAASYKTVQQFARRGGPDLTSLRGFTYQALNTDDMTSYASSTSRKRPNSSRRTQSTQAHSTSNSNTNSKTTTTRTGASSKSSSYSKNFRQKLIDCGVYPETHLYADGTGHPQPANFDDILDRLRQPRPSLSPSRFTTQHFLDFKRAHAGAAGESSTVYSLGPTISGAEDRKFTKDTNRLFNNLEPFDSDISVPQPDAYDGVAPESIHLQVRKDLNKIILPSTDDSLPAAPNFFGEWKGPQGRADVAEVQACHDGAVGSRALHRLKNYLRPVEYEQYDNIAHSFSSTYHSGTATLQLYTHHMTAPVSSGGKPEHHMTQLRGYHMTSDRDGFVNGATAYRNLRELASEMRSDAVNHATRAGKLSHTVQAGDRMNNSYESFSSDTSIDELALDVDQQKRRRTNVTLDSSSSLRRSQQLMTPVSSTGNGSREQRTTRQTNTKARRRGKGT